MSAIFSVSGVAKTVAASAEDPATIYNVTGGSVYYKTAADVDTGDTEIAAAANAEVTSPVWIIATAAAPAKVLVLRNADRRDTSVPGDLIHTGSAVGFYGVTPATRPSAYTVTNHTADKTYDANTAADAELADVLGSVIKDLVTLGILQGTVSA